MKPLIFQSDFGLADGAVSAMHGVAFSVCPDLNIQDLTHEIPQYDIWEASYRLTQTIRYWMEGTVFVSVVDPGVGSDRRSVVAKTMNGVYIVTPDNGTLTHIKQFVGITELREIDERVNRLPGTAEDYTFHGRDVYAYTGARLASGLITFEEVGPSLDPQTALELPTYPCWIDGGDTAVGTIDVLDVRFGNVWTNIRRSVVRELNLSYGDRVEVEISCEGRLYYKHELVYTRSFSQVSVGEPLAYINSLDCLAVAINQGSFAKAYNIGTGNNWLMRVRKIR
ncbi:MAG: S-adenosyl-l-methionine hydroxide adenosyltransferase family protein [Oscillospiraceae bacterium]|nr:S-adenosyl-l-methionine hydroxide adenosyltransferase family protein [Oscillospiraceae bacterium]